MPSFDLFPQPMSKWEFWTAAVEHELHHPSGHEQWPITQLRNDLRAYGFRELHVADDYTGCALALGEDVLLSFAHLGDRYWVEWQHFWTSPLFRRKGESLDCLDTIHRIA